MNSIIISARFLSTMKSRDVRELVYYIDTHVIFTCTRDFNKHKLSSTIEIYRLQYSIYKYRELQKYDSEIDEWKSEK
jgi:hypothetical protein